MIKSKDFVRKKPSEIRLHLRALNVIGILFVITSCSSATPVSTIESLSLVNPGWEGVILHTLCIDINQSYPEVDGEFSLPLNEIVKTTLAMINVKAVSNETSCDASLNITTVTYAVAGMYPPVGACYTAADVTGEATLTAEEHEPLILPIQWSVPPAQTVVGGCSSEPRDAPFAKAWTEAFLDVSARLWSPYILIKVAGEHLPGEGRNINLSAESVLNAVDPLPNYLYIDALGDENRGVQIFAIQELGNRGQNAREAIPVLIAKLRDEDDVIRALAHDALTSITQEDFGPWPDDWEAWWEKQK